MQKLINSIGLVLILLLAYACSDIVVPDIEDEAVALVAPIDSLTTTRQTHNFVWDEVDDATSYQIQIVTPSFAGIVNFVLDSMTTATSYEVTLQEGEYEWRVLAVNEAYTSSKDSAEVRRIFVRSDANVDLSNQVITLLSPNNSLVSNDSIIDFSWNTLTGADKYILQIGDVGFNSFNLIEELVTSSSSFTFEDDGEYQWRVRAESDLSQTFTPWATRQISLDRTPPAAPDLEFPTSGASILAADQSPDLFWISDSDVLQDTLFVYHNGQRDSLVFKAPASLEYNLEDSGFDFNQPLPEDYFWQVISVDPAGNVSDSSELRLIFIQ